jgi:hypothetical protein
VRRGGAYSVHRIEASDPEQQEITPMASKNVVPSNAQWARWNWSHKGLGRWHRLFADGDLTKTACGSPRKDGQHAAAVAASKPTSGPMCPTCKWIVELDEKMHGVTDAISDQQVMAGIETPAEAPLPALAPVGARPADVVVPQGVCVCGCDKSDAAIAFRAKIAARRAEQRAFDEAQVAAILAARKTAAVA